MNGLRHPLLSGALGLLLSLGLTGSTVQAARSQPLDLQALEIELSGPPVAVLPADLNRDGRLDLLIITAFTFWGETSTYSSETLDGELWQTVEVIPTLKDRRQMQLYLGQDAGGYAPSSPPQDLPPTVLAFDTGPPGHPVLAITAQGLSDVRLENEQAGQPLVFHELIHEPPVFAGSGGLLPGYRFTADIDGDSIVEILFPSSQGLALYRAGAAGLQLIQPPLPLPGDALGRDGVAWRNYPLPVVEDVTGDGILDLVVMHSSTGRALARFEDDSSLDSISILRGTGEGLFAPPRALHTPAFADSASPTPLEALQLLLTRRQLPGTLSFFGDLDGDHVAELVTYRQHPGSGKEGFRQEMKQAKRPLHDYSFHRVSADGIIDPEPYLQLTAQGYPFSFDWLAPSPGGFVDLNGDGRKDLITVDLDFSLWQVPKILMARSIGAGLDFHIWMQEDDGGFRQVSGRKLRGKLKVNLRHLRLVEFAQFAGDFDGDSHIDFIRLGGGRKVSIHRGQEDGTYPSQPDLTLTLNRAPLDTGLVKVRDLNGDGRSDLMVMTVLNTAEEGETRATRVEFYLSRGKE